VDNIHLASLNNNGYGLVRFELTSLNVLNYAMGIPYIRRPFRRPFG
jgi:hypothetical protein